MRGHTAGDGHLRIGGREIKTMGDYKKRSLDKVTRMILEVVEVGSHTILLANEYGERRQFPLSQVVRPAQGFKIGSPQSLQVATWKLVSVGWQR